MIYSALNSLVLFPGNLLAVLLLLCLWQRKKAPVLVRCLAIFTVVFYMLSTPFVGDHLLMLLETPYQPLDDREGERPQAIVVLSAGVLKGSPEYDGRPIPTEFSIMRMKYGARLHRETGLPIMVAGGKIGGVVYSEVLARSYREDFGIENVWTETGSRSTGENAFYVTKFLREKKITRVYLVTHSWHMPRSVLSFENYGMEVVPAPTVFVYRGKLNLNSFLPSANALRSTNYALHEAFGLLWYKLMFRFEQGL